MTNDITWAEEQMLRFGKEEGCREERVRVVAWLRDEAKRYDTDDYHEVVSLTLRDAADAIERGVK